jgi:hypothetical protein
MNERAERELGTDVRLLADRLIIDLMLAHNPPDAPPPSALRGRETLAKTCSL